MILPRVRQHGLILFDNMHWTGRVAGDLSNDPNGQAIELDPLLPKCLCPSS